MAARLLACAMFCLLPWTAAAQPPAPQAEPDGITRLIFELERAVAAGDAEAVRALTVPGIRAAPLSEFVQSLTFPKASQAAIKERDRAAHEGSLRVLIETFTDR